MFKLLLRFSSVRFSSASIGFLGSVATIVLIAALPRVHGAQIVTLASFANTNGSRPSTSVVIGADGNVYGTTFYGGQVDYGTTYKLTTNGALTSLFAFAVGAYPTNGAYPSGGLIFGKDGNLYGTTSANSRYGGSGTIFRMTITGTITTMFTFAPEVFVGGPASYTNSNGAHPEAGLTPGNDGNLYGTTAHGGTSGTGTVFAMTTTGALTSLVSFDALADDGTGTWTLTNTFGGHPGDLTLGKDGAFYGAAGSGGMGGVGTLFKVTTNGVLTPIFSFDRTVEDDLSGLVSNMFGAYRNSRLTMANDGCFYGSASDGGSNWVGTIFRLTPSNQLTVLVTFAAAAFNQANHYTNENGIFPSGGLTLGNDGALYGITSGGGSTGYGTVFKVTTNGLLTKLAEFSGSSGPDAALTLGPDGNFYGTTDYGGAYGYGTVFKLDLSVPTSIPLSYSLHGNQLVLTWASAAFRLQFASDLTGPFSDVPSVTSPCTNTFTGSQRYFRLIANP